MYLGINNNKGCLWYFKDIFHQIKIIDSCLSSKKMWFKSGGRAGQGYGPFPPIHQLKKISLHQLAGNFYCLSYYFLLQKHHSVSCCNWKIHSSDFIKTRSKQCHYPNGRKAIPLFIKARGSPLYLWHDLKVHPVYRGFH